MSKMSIVGLHQLFSFYLSWSGRCLDVTYVIRAPRGAAQSYPTQPGIRTVRAVKNKNVFIDSQVNESHRAQLGAAPDSVAVSCYFL